MPMVSINNIKNHFEKDLFKNLQNLEIERNKIIRYVMVAKILNILTLTLFFSLFLGFLNAFPFEDFGMGIAMYFFEGFFYLVLSFVAFGIVNKGVKYILEIKKQQKLIKNKAALTSLTLTLTALCLFCAWLIGRKYLGDETAELSFILRYFIAFFAMLFLGFTASGFQKYEERFNYEFKLKILPLILTFFDNSLQFSSSTHIKQSLFTESGLFRNKEIHAYLGSDDVQGSYGDNNFEFSQLNVSQITTTISGGKTETRIENLFKGIFYVADFKKNFTGTTLIYPDYARKLFDDNLGERINSAMEFDHYQLVTLEDNEFEKEFVVYATDQVDARFILNPTIIEQIKMIRSKFGKEISISFANQKLFIAITDDSDLFCPLIFNNVTDFETIEPIYRIVETLCEILADMNLKTGFAKTI